MKPISKSSKRILGQLVGAFLMSMASAAGQTVWYEYVRPNLPKAVNPKSEKRRAGF